MPDQATILRGIIETRLETQSESSSTRPRRARTIAVTSGKGGVGKSNIALNMAIAMSRLGKSVCLLDACLGLGNIDLLCGLNGYWNLSHVVTGSRALKDVVLDGPDGIHVIPGASGLIELADCPENVQRELLFQMQELERDHDLLIVDTSTGIHRIVRQFATAADQVLLVTTPETTSIADAYSTIKALAASDCPPLDIVVNQAESASQAKAIAARLQQTSKMFLKKSVGYVGHVSRDSAVASAVSQRKPFVVESANCPAATDIHQLARRVISTGGSLRTFRSYFDRFGTQKQRVA
ncbi:MAG: MinD/ParA family protein [Planctomycetota bacterium]|nr:MinD/ParA family protein [Planctomycetota bacterium]